MVLDNPGDWEETFLHPVAMKYKRANYSKLALQSVMPHCYDIYNFPLFNEHFCDIMVAEAEEYGQWSGSKNKDDRIKGGHEPVPTQDIHFKQMGFGDQWVRILRDYVAPVAEANYIGYNFRGTETLDFIVRYKSDGGQPALRPHHDASTFSLNVTLNKIGVDFEGGGTRFTRQNCTMLSNAKGHTLMHPGILTHQHEG